jgi:biotin carboxylase
MRDVTRRVVARLGLGDGLFNVEMMWDEERDRVSIIEINPRMCGQFGDLYLAVDGTSTFEVALDLATGAAPRFTRGGGRMACAASHPLRVFEPVEVLRSPGEAEVRAIEERHPGALIWNECTTGERIGEFLAEDGASHRYGVINLGGSDPIDREDRFEEIRTELGWRFEPL